MSSDGSRATARAMATRCACPPDSSRGCRLAYRAGSRPTRSRSSSARLRRELLLPTWCAASGSSTMERICHFGSSDPNGSCHTNCMSRRAATSDLPCSLVSSLPRKTTDPDFGLGACKTARASVDLPDPVSPTMPRVSPGMMSNDTLDNAWTTPPLAPPASRTTNSWTRSRTDSRGCLSLSLSAGAVLSGAGVTPHLRSRMDASRPTGDPVRVLSGPAPSPCSRRRRWGSAARTSSRPAACSCPAACR